ncbi:hypothetical protein llap_19512 [Limosa lapponica baueri]|uniref:Uncharacterized protein n=1 Tax=Limosa lapponica baueri TaxID=1758121 RepID=A0A2I0T8R4_LIMLA|nr:hypothetical protein llap_19512 [Limosa lapponica baueri]
MIQKRCHLLLNKLFWMAAMGEDGVLQNSKCGFVPCASRQTSDIFRDTAAVSLFSVAGCCLLKRKMLLYLTDYFFLHPKKRLTLYFSIGRRDEDRLSRRKSIVDTVSIQVDILPGNNTEDKIDNTEEITFEALKKAIDNNGLEEQEKEKRRLVIEKFQKAPFEEIAAQCETKANLLHDRLAQILELTIR